MSVDRKQDSTLQWLEWARAIQAICQNGLAFAQNPFDIERYQSLQKLAAEIIESHSRYDMAVIQERFAEEKGYATPKVDVRSVAFNDGKLLMVQHSHDHKWAMPGGWADAGLSPAEVALKELHEEAGFEGAAIKLIGVYDLGRHYKRPYLFDTYKLFVQCRLLGGEFKPNLETRALDFFGIDEIPPLSGGRTAMVHVTEAFAHLNDPHRPTAFD